MSKNGVGTYSLMLSVILWGVLLGGVVYSHLVYFPVFLGSLPDSAILVNGPHALNEGRFWMTIHPLVILSLIASIVLNWRQRVRRKLILITFGLYIAVIVVTSLYFLPELFAFAESPRSNVSPADWLERGNRWQYFSWIRGAVLFICIVPLLFAMITPDGHAPRDHH